MTGLRWYVVVLLGTMAVGVAGEMQVRVSGVDTGTTFAARDAGGARYYVHLLGCTAPPLRMRRSPVPEGEYSRAALSRVMLGKIVYLKIHTTTPALIEADVFRGEGEARQWINREIVACGMCRAHPQQPDAQIEAAEASARRSKRGLWGRPEFHAPRPVDDFGPIKWE